MRFTSIAQALFELYNIAKGGVFGVDNKKELVVVNPQAKMSAGQIHTTSNDNEMPLQVFATNVIYKIQHKCTPLERAFINYYWGYEDLFDCMTPLERLAKEMSGSFELNKCYILYYRDKCKRVDHYSKLAGLEGISQRTAKNKLHDRKSIKRIILDGFYKKITDVEFELASSILKILKDEDLIKFDIQG